MPPSLDQAFRTLLWAAMLVLSVTSLACLLRAILGPRFTDRVVMVNIICTKAVIMIAILAYLLEESYLLDIAIVYAMISFLAVVVLGKCYLLPHHINPADPGHNFHSREEEEEEL